MAAGVVLILPVLLIGIAFARPAVGFTVLVPFIMLFVGHKYGDILGKRILENDGEGSGAGRESP